MSALRELRASVGTRRIAILGMLTLAASLSEGAGLFLLIPIAHAIAGGGELALPAPLDFASGISAGELLALLVVAVAIRAVIVYLANELRRGIQLELSRAFRARLYHAIARAEWRWLAGRDSSDHAALVVGEAERSASLFTDAATIFNASATMAILALAALLVSPAATLVGLSLAVLPLLAMVLLKARRSREGTAFWAAYSQLQSSLSNGIAKLRSARISGADRALAGEFDEASSALSQLERSYFRRGHQIQTAFQILAVISLAGLVYFGLERGDLSLALFLPVLILVVRAIPLLNQVHQAWRSWRYNSPAMSRVLDEAQQAEANREMADTGHAPPPFERMIEFAQVGLSYTGRGGPVLENFSLRIGKGDCVAVTGPSGTGKSTLADLLSGLLMPDSGSILIDGTALSEHNRAAWRSSVGYLEQNPFFFSGSLRDNLTWGLTQIDDAAIASSLTRASADFVNAWPEGTATSIGEGGRQLSGGELRRLAMARVLLRNPSVLILDEVTASLDRRNAAAVLDAIAGLKGEVTIVALTHDPRVIELADSVCDLERVR